MFNKFKASLPEFDINPILKSLKDSLTEPSSEDLESRDSPSCELVQVREGNLPAVFIINGFLSGNTDCSNDWLEVVDELYPNNQVIRVDWKAGNLKDMMFDKGVTPNIPAGKGGKAGFAATLMARANLLGIMATAGAFVLDKVMGHWKSSFYETRHVAVSLAAYLEQNSEFKNCILMGHSLGARIVRHTLSELTTQNRVSTVYLFAGAVSSEEEQWEELLYKHEKVKVINCMSMKDNVLKSAYKAGTLWDHEPVGLFPVMDEHFNTLNLDVTEYASGHMDFKQKELGQYLNNELRQLCNEKQQQLFLTFR